MGSTSRSKSKSSPSCSILHCQEVIINDSNDGCVLYCTIISRIIGSHRCSGWPLLLGICRIPIAIIYHSHSSTMVRSMMVNMESSQQWLFLDVRILDKFPSFLPRSMGHKWDCDWQCIQWFQLMSSTWVKASMPVLVPTWATWVVAAPRSLAITRTTAHFQHYWGWTKSYWISYWGWWTSINIINLSDFGVNGRALPYTMILGVSRSSWHLSAVLWGWYCSCGGSGRNSSVCDSITSICARHQEIPHLGDLSIGVITQWR